MKKLIFGIAALFMMSVVLVSCDNKKSKKDKDDEDEDDRTEQVADDEEIDEDEDAASFGLSREDQFVNCLEDLVALMKRTHIDSEDDVEEFAVKARKIKSKVDDLISQYGDGLGENLSEDEQMELIEKVEKLSNAGEKEANRLMKEAEAAGIDLSELDDLDIF